MPTTTTTTEPRELTLMGRAERMLAEARNVDTIKEIRDKADAAKAYAKKAGLSKDIILHAAAIKVQAERRMGQSLINLPLADSAPGNQLGKPTGDHHRRHKCRPHQQSKSGVTRVTVCENVSEGSAFQQRNEQTLH